jgi:hypothetical protein
MHVTGLFASMNGNPQVSTDGRDFSSVGGSVAGAHDVLFWGIDTMIGGYATETVNSTGSILATYPTQLIIGNGFNWVVNGRIELRQYFQAKGGKGHNYSDTATPYLWSLDAGNYAYISDSTGKVTVVTAGGTPYTTASGASWSDGDVLRVDVMAGGGNMNTVVKFNNITAGGGQTTLGTSSSPQAGIDVSSAQKLRSHCDYLGLNTFGCRLYKVEAYSPGTLANVP